MAIEALIFDVGGVLLELDWEKCEEDKNRQVPMRLGVEPEEAVFVDDKVENVEAARQLGIQSIRFQHTEQALAEIQKVLQAR